MKILVDISHPAHVHFFKHAIAEWRAHGHDVAVASRRKDLTVDLLDALGLAHTVMSTCRRGKAGLLFELLEHDWNLYRFARRFRPDVLCQIGGIFVAHVGVLLRKPAVIFYDTEMNRAINRITYPLAAAVVTPSGYQGRVGRNHVTYEGYHELAYLHPRRFTPDPEVVRSAGLDPQGRYFILRFVGWGAAHDLRERGLSLQTKLAVVRRLAGEGRVLISSEAPLPAELAGYRSTVPPQLIHHVMAFASLVAGESATMASEAAVLGVPAMFVSTSPRGYTEEQEHRYGLVRNFRDYQQAEVLPALEKLLARCGDRPYWQEKRARLLADKIDVTAFVVKLIGKLPVSGASRKRSAPIRK